MRGTYNISDTTHEVLIDLVLVNVTPSGTGIPAVCLRKCLKYRSIRNTGVRAERSEALNTSITVPKLLPPSSLILWVV